MIALAPNGHAIEAGTPREPECLATLFGMEGHRWIKQVQLPHDVRVWAAAKIAIQCPTCKAVRLTTAQDRTMTFLYWTHDEWLALLQRVQQW